MKCEATPVPIHFQNIPKEVLLPLQAQFIMNIQLNIKGIDSWINSIRVKTRAIWLRLNRKSLSILLEWYIDFLLDFN